MWTILEKELQLHPISSWKLIHGAECWGDDVRNEALRGGWRYKAWLEMPPGRVRRGRFYSQLCLRGDVKPTCWGGVRASCREAPDAGGWQGRRHQLWRRGYRAAPFQGMNLSVQGICTGIAQLQAVPVAALAFEKFIFLQKEVTISLHRLLTLSLLWHSTW